MVNNMSKVFKLIIDDGNEPIILEEDEIKTPVENAIKNGWFKITRGFLYFNYHVVWGETHLILFYALEVYFRNI